VTVILLVSREEKDWTAKAQPMMRFCPNIIEKIPINNGRKKTQNRIVIKRAKAK
jgi:hypothetical protein